MLRAAMDDADGWFICRIGFVETTRAVSLATGHAVATAIRAEWPAFGVIEVDQDLAEHSAELALSRDLRSLDALHLAAVLVLPRSDLVMATWDRRLHAAALAEGLALLPAELD
jgi:predicted nucleic acid-binding protein